MRRKRLLTAFCLSLLLHAYVGARLLPALWLTAPGYALGIAFLLVSALLMPAPLMIRLSGLPERSADLLAWSGYLAMGIFSSLIVLCLLRDAILMLAGLWTLMSPGALDFNVLAHDSSLAVVATTVMISLIGIANARRVAAVKDVRVPIAGLPAALVDFTIVQLSDIHVGPTIKRSYVEAIVRSVNQLDADLVAITGDVVDGSVARLRPHVAPLAQLRSRHGTFCVTGNHEYYHGVEAWIAEWRRIGLRPLLNEGQLLDHDGACLLVAGVTDFSGHHYSPDHASDPEIAIRGHTAQVNILLAHQPRSAPAAAAAGFDVQLSGHTHGGQMLPWNLLVPMQQPFVSGLKRLDRLWVYTSRGTGYWGPPLRFGAPSEITRLRLVAAPLGST
jgi:predicted MPP superfamily phosphohydrolase